LHIEGEDGEFAIQLADERVDIAARVELDDSLRIVHEELENLPPDYREILVLRDIEGLPYDEIATALDISLANVKVRIHRARELLKRRLVDRGLV
jgi:RNA polymerase sigma-70 factor (ECF subfamily)